MWDMVHKVPKVHKFFAILFALINVILPGWGTMFAACFASVEETVSKSQVVIGLVQFLTSFALIGWLASIYWGYLLVKEAWHEDEDTKGQQHLEQPQISKSIMP